MILYVDENIPKHLAQGFEVLQIPEGLKLGVDIKVKYIPSEFGQGVKDEEWIPEVGKEKACVLTQDMNINRRKHELALYRKHGVGMFFLKGASKKQGMSVWKMVEALARNWPAMTHIMLNEKRPFAYQLGIKGKIKSLD